MRISATPPGRGPAQQIVRAGLQRWDPIGSIRAGGPADEYDDLVEPVLETAASGAGAETLGSALRQVLRSDYGLSRPEGECVDVARDVLEGLHAGRHLPPPGTTEPAPEDSGTGFVRG
ncbi:hypothetical protein [Desertihabitans brevis]|uniref:hypothetical protein n=1 Tax=Desertihabitans brevis TaxID=2268447 RepID=UPI0011BE55B9|nr:hypothetical protein [Desertihabitans brevis]